MFHLSDTNNQSIRWLSWQAAPSHHLTEELAHRGQTSRPVDDPWITGYRVDRREYTPQGNLLECTPGVEDGPATEDG